MDLPGAPAPAAPAGPLAPCFSPFSLFVALLAGRLQGAAAQPDESLDALQALASALAAWDDLPPQHQVSREVALRRATAGLALPPPPVHRLAPWS